MAILDTAFINIPPTAGLGQGRVTGKRATCLKKCQKQYSCPLFRGLWMPLQSSQSLTLTATDLLAPYGVHKRVLRWIAERWEGGGELQAGRSLLLSQLFFLRRYRICDVSKEVIYRERGWAAGEKCYYDTLKRALFLQQQLPEKQKWNISFDVRTQWEWRQKNSRGLTHLKEAHQPVSLNLPVISCHKVSLEYCLSSVSWTQRHNNNCQTVTVTDADR